MAKKLRIRKFLNKMGYQTTAFIYVSANKYDDDGWVGADVQIGDCDRRVSLTCGYNSGNPKEKANAQHKLDTLIESLQKTREFLFNE